MKTKTRRVLAVIAALLLWAATPTSRAQSGGTYDMSWSTIDAGGGTMTGGTYTLSGTVGQHDVGRVSGGPYTLTGGFWDLAPVEVPLELSAIIIR